ncbi:alpha/beta fold hydrolase [Actinoallomurus rhizosphaericola]|uniref:alpha/beta fold hydrolase n=1 Tax=Actinoallomurus rhizosphaericola TaxID=2952536 RepID=UPI002090CCA5|nr:alpha/beta hydrolase [Actinoallomurus rhizosphaericola]MCO5994607.1 alpha/beta hydrolase [Actinoallomurus rhizosphaericola]
MTEFLDVDGGRIAYEVAGEGPLVVLAHGMGDLRSAYRFLAPRLVEAGFRVASADLRGHGESSTGWASYSRTDTAGDLLALIRHLGSPAVVVGHSFAGGAATIAAAQEPDLVNAVVEIDPFTRAQKLDLGGLLRVGRYRKGLTLLMRAGMFGSLEAWARYLDHAYPVTKPADFADQVGAIRASLSDKDRMAALQKMGQSKPTDAGAQLPNLSCPALVVMGTLDPDWADPKAEADGVVAMMPAGRGTVAMIEGAGHYPHAQFPEEVAAVMVPFLKEHTA